MGSTGAQVYEEAYKLFSRHDGGQDSEWPNLRRDLADLAGPAPLRHKIRISKRMSRVRLLIACLFPLQVSVS